jgi:predicted DNA-binding antitoxin AbrB/MazE fold protein
MIAVNGIYENGIVRLDKKIQAKKTVKVIVTFLDEELHNNSKRLTSKDFSFLQAREKSKRYKGSLSDAVIEDRKAEI